VGPRHPAAGKLRPGDRVASLVSLTLTPLQLEEVRRVDLATDWVDVRGHAILFASGQIASMPADLPEGLVLAALDVCGAPALTARLVKRGDRVLILGAGKSGALCCAQAMRAVRKLEEAGYARGLALDATQALAVHAAVSDATAGALCDLVINTASVAGTEMATLLCVREGGTALFFSMATSFTAAALGAEGVGKDATLLIGNGYARGHAELTLDLLRAEPALRALLSRRFGDS
jgi:L-erythro-3,5-diaminohexanoate dehydrogenase